MERDAKIGLYSEGGIMGKAGEPDAKRIKAGLRAVEENSNEEIVEFMSDVLLKETKEGLTGLPRIFSRPFENVILTIHGNVKRR